MIKAIRPRQWVKNVLVLVAPLAALGTDVHYDYRFLAARVAVAFVVFSMAASCIYLINDARDIEADRQHPTKRFRPIAAGVVPVPLAYGLAVVLGVAALTISYLVSHNLAVVIAVYIGIQLAYCFGLKHQAVLDICIVSSAYLIRAIAGGAAPISNCPSGSCWCSPSGRCSWPRVSGTQSFSLPNAPAQDPEITGELYQFVSAVRLDALGDRRGVVLRPVRLRTRWRFGVVVGRVDHPVHHRDPALRRRHRRRRRG